MESASKALIMAGGILIALMVASLMIYLFRTGAIVGENYENRKSSEQIEAFNAKFEVYQKDNNTISDVISVANLAYSINAQNYWDNINKVEVVVKLSDSSSATTLEIIANENLPKNVFLKNGNLSNEVDFYSLMEKDINTLNLKFNINIAKKNDTDKLTDVNIDNVTSGERNYRYYFKIKEDGFHYNDTTGLIDKVVFVLDGPKFP